MPTEMLTVAGPAGHDLSGAMETPEGDLRGVAVFAHCFTCTKQSRAAVAVARGLAERGIACLRFDFTGLGGSEGEFGRAGFASDVADLVAAGRALNARYACPILMVGHSLGGAAALAAVDDLGEENVAAIATIGAPAHVPHVLKRIEGDLAEVRETGEGAVRIGGRPFSISRGFLARVENVDLLTEVAWLRVPLLLMHSPTDALVGVENAALLFDAAMHPKSFVSLDGADHLLLDDDDAGYVAQVIAAWASRHLARPSEPAA